MLLIGFVAKDHLTEEVAIKEVVHVWNHHLAPPLSRDTGIPSGGGNNTAMSSVQSPSYDYATDNQCSSNIIHYIHLKSSKYEALDISDRIDKQVISPPGLDILTGPLQEDKFES
ncbi:unnamed protein product [Rhizophagus irregularis]|uniref:Uncharacterized protein n=1 Tax=Rhizophagus irregularis TaxID=588596 RepID=A0A916ED86_9GLOM|nr:unnamed protein product [Rhizophagus irregularis]CAB5379145.1 unnamed protein product [Rhizophagus irregularis]